MDKTANDPAAIFHAVANSLNSIIVTIQLQERYLARDTGEMRELISDTSKNLKHEIETLQWLIDQLRKFLI
jgi:hypothetical protein